MVCASWVTVPAAQPVAAVFGIGGVRVASVVGSMTTALTGTRGRLAATEVQAAPQLVELNRSPGLYPAVVLGPPGKAPAAAYTMFVWVGSTASWPTNPAI